MAFTNDLYVGIRVLGPEDERFSRDLLSRVISRLPAESMRHVKIGSGTLVGSAALSWDTTDHKYVCAHVSPPEAEPAGTGTEYELSVMEVELSRFDRALTALTFWRRRVDVGFAELSAALERVLEEDPRCAARSWLTLDRQGNRIPTTPPG